MLVGVAERDLSTTVLGRELPHPLLTAPMAFQKLAHPEGELALARAAAATGTTLTLATLANTAHGEMSEALPEASRWFQLYVFRDRGVTDAMVESAVEHGFEAIVLTVDLPVAGLRESDVSLGWTLPPDLRVPALEAAHGSSELTFADALNTVDPALEWSDLEELAAGPLPVIVKGILRPDDAELAIEHGAAAIVVSNHGGRQLDTVLPTAEALAPIVDAVEDRVDVLVDGGIRRGTDVVKAIALGASAVLVGRPLLWGLAAAARPARGACSSCCSRTWTAAWPCSASRRCRASGRTASSDGAPLAPGEAGVLLGEAVGVRVRPGVVAQCVDDEVEQAARDLAS